MFGDNVMNMTEGLFIEVLMVKAGWSGEGDSL